MELSAQSGAASAKLPASGRARNTSTGNLNPIGRGARTASVGADLVGTSSTRHRAVTMMAGSGTGNATAAAAAGGGMLPGGDGGADEAADKADNLQQLANVLTDDTFATNGGGGDGNGISLVNAPILGEDLMKVASDGDASGAGSVHELQRRVEQVMINLQVRLHAQEVKFRKHWWRLDFDEPKIEEDYRHAIFKKNRDRMIIVAVLLNIYNLITVFGYAALSLMRDEAPPAIAGSACRPSTCRASIGLRSTLAAASTTPTRPRCCWRTPRPSYGTGIGGS